MVKFGTLKLCRRLTVLLSFENALTANWVMTAVICGLATYKKVKTSSPVKKGSKERVYSSKLAQPSADYDLFKH